MTFHPHVPADDDATSMLDLVDDAREVSGVLAPYLPAHIQLPEARGALPLEIGPLAAAGVEGWGDYGS
jgi:hypothetical protein